MSEDNSLETWILGIDEALEELKKEHDKDRLAILGKIYACAAAIDGSIKGWHGWLTNPRLMSKYTTEDLESLMKMFKDIAIKLLEEDKKWTERRIEEDKENEESTNCMDSTSTIYV